MESSRDFRAGLSRYEYPISQSNRRASSRSAAKDSVWGFGFFSSFGKGGSHGFPVKRQGRGGGGYRQRFGSVRYTTRGLYLALIKTNILSSSPPWASGLYL